jgi:surface carbohydrate biosynthesis protein
MSSARACLIVDNPLRDLDGLCLVALHLLDAGLEPWLVPMYRQVSDVPTLAPAVVVCNYLRPNNLELVRHYRSLGSRIVVLDTEGAAGKSPAEFAHMMRRMPCAELIDLYLVWGEDQRRAFINAGVMPPDRIIASGCPRYDFCVPPWRNCLPAPDMEPGYVLVNTNFPVVNPRFSSGSGDELAAMRSVGFSEEFARAYVVAATRAYEGVVEMIGELAARDRRRKFVLRPHPFENLRAYQALLEHDNVVLRQEGTSIEWIARCSLLLHLNCSTAVEAALMGKASVTPEWINSEVLRIPLVSAVSKSVESVDELLAQFLDVEDDIPPSTVSGMVEVLSGIYGAVDGDAALRAAGAIASLVRASAGELTSREGKAPPTGYKFRAGIALRRALGFKGTRLAMRIMRGQAPEVRAAAKAFSAERLADRMRELSACSLRPATAVQPHRLAGPLGSWNWSGQSVRIQAPERAA